MCLCVRDIDNLNIPKVSLKIIEYFLIYDELCVFCLLLSWDSNVGYVELVPGMSCVC